MVKKGGDLDSLATELVNDYSARKKRIPGYGHRLHETDPRTVELFKLAGELGFSDKHLKLAQGIEKKLEETSGKKLPLNVDGAIAAVISDMGFDWRLGKGFFIISRVPGLIAHAYEELTREKPMRKLGNTDFEYDGPKPRKIP
jgi:citryl-CoA lyase